ncbi:Hypothetical predicted protein [Octopus vulgaris]|uniref:Uncharacterized protein n=1 Tax=Octopus vulgaris TaxID=6645 RepID=A0AA36BLH9_OCTVU|nr:Hypothetical predicted protein [Octopus vulgaris]
MTVVVYSDIIDIMRGVIYSDIRYTVGDMVYNHCASCDVLISQILALSAPLKRQIPDKFSKISPRFCHGQKFFEKHDVNSAPFQVITFDNGKLSSYQEQNKTLTILADNRSSSKKNER